MNQMKKIRWYVIALLVGASGIGMLTPGHGSAAVEVDVDATKRLEQNYGSLPLSFELNQGQAPDAVRFLSRGPGYGLFLMPGEAILALTRPSDAQEGQVKAAVVSMRLAGATSKPAVIGLDLMPGKSNYFIGNDPARWQTNVAQYGKVKYQSVYPGIDLIYYGNQRQLEYDLVVAPGADPKKIRLAFKGVKTLTIDKAGRLVLDTGRGTLIQNKPIVYQMVGGERKALDGISGRNVRSQQAADHRPGDGVLDVSGGKPVWRRVA
jgi:hypothetical protein